MSDPRIAGIATAVPDVIVGQNEVREVVEALFSDRIEGLNRLLSVFDHTHVKQRHFIKPASWYAKERGWREFNEAYVEAAVALSTKAGKSAINNSGLNADAFGGIVVASTTGVMTPSLDSVVAQALGFSGNCIRLPIFGLGCAGGVAGLARAADLWRVSAGKPMLFIAVEVCTATFQPNDTSKSNLVGSSLFADGAAAVVLHDSGDGPYVRSGHSTLFPDTEDIMGWEVTDTGLKVRFARDIPTFVREHLPDVLKGACHTWGIDLDDVRSFVTHPGGQKVLDAYADAVGRSKSKFSTAFNVLQDHGNMSSASVLFVLERQIRNAELPSGFALMSALGPGFSSEQLLLEVP